MNKSKPILALIGDIILLYLSLWITLAIRFGLPTTSERWNQHLLPFSVVFIFWIIIFYINKLYDLKSLDNKNKFLNLLLVSLAWCAIIGFIFFYIATTGINPKTILIINIIVFGILFIIWRRFFNSLISQTKYRDNCLIIGLSKDSLSLGETINKKPQMGMIVKNIIKLEGDHQIASDKIEIISLPADFNKYLQDNKIKTIIINKDENTPPEIINSLYHSLTGNISIFDLPSFAEIFLNKILVNSIGQVWFLENLRENSKQVHTVIKRIIDIILSIILLIISTPFLPILFILIKSSSKGPFLFMQQRTGKYGKKFMAVKLRTMFQNAETNGPQWASKNDPRVTPIGKFLRKSRVDEIPQLINVLRGEMSFIGPRPERPEFIEELKKDIPFYESRLLIKPGLTGWAQVNFPYGASKEDALEKLQYDLYYIKNRSLSLDISILLKTIKTVLSGGGQ